jgi:hypothetical protein
MMPVGAISQHPLLLPHAGASPHQRPIAGSIVQAFRTQRQDSRIVPRVEHWVRTNKPAIAKRADAVGLKPFSAAEIRLRFLFKPPAECQWE